MPVLFFFREGEGCLLISLPVNVVHKKINSSYSSCVSSVHSSLKIQLPDKKKQFFQSCAKSKIMNYFNLKNLSKAENFLKTNQTTLQSSIMIIKPRKILPAMLLAVLCVIICTKTLTSFITNFSKLSQHEDHYFNDSIYR